MSPLNVFLPEQLLLHGFVYVACNLMAPVVSATTIFNSRVNSFVNIAT